MDILSLCFEVIYMKLVFVAHVQVELCVSDVELYVSNIYGLG